MPTNFLDVQFNIDYRSIKRELICYLDSLCLKEQYENKACDIAYLLDKYNESSVSNLNKSLVYYCLGNCIVNKIYRYGLLHSESLQLYDLFEEVSQRHRNLHINDNGLYQIFSGLIQYDSNYVYGLNLIHSGLCLLTTEHNDVYLTGDFLYGVKLIQPIPTNLIEINSSKKNNDMDNMLIRCDNIKVLVNYTIEPTIVYINFTTDIIYFMAFVESFYEIIKQLYLTEDISQCGFFWNVIIDKQNYDNKKIMNEFIIKSQFLFDSIKSKNSIIITTQVFDQNIVDKALFTTYRFINMYKYMQITKKPIIQSDIDFSDLRNLNQFIHNIKQFDIGLFRVRSTPWRRVCATLSYFSNENLVSMFASVYGIFLKFFYQSHTSNWFIDQLCLTLTEQYLSNTISAEINICSLYKYSKETFFFSTQYKNQQLCKYKDNLSKSITLYNPINIYIYWNTGFEKCPLIVKQCVQSWKIKNPDQNIYLLDDQNIMINKDINISEIYDFIPQYDHLANIISKQSKSDIIRLYLLKKYGGIWIDSTCFCNLPLTYWINKINKSDFFAFHLPGRCLTPANVLKERLIDNWFLYSSQPSSYIVEKWFASCITNWNELNPLNRNIYFENGQVFYFWVHLLFNDLYDNDILFQESFQKCSFITVGSPQYLEHRHHSHKYLLDILNVDCKNHIDNYTSPLYKLTWKFDIKIINELNVLFKDSILHYLFEKNGLAIDNYM